MHLHNLQKITQVRTPVATSERKNTTSHPPHSLATVLDDTYDEVIIESREDDTRVGTVGV